jgi:hypothetical protein
MAFIGNTNTTQAFTPAVDYFSGNASTTAFTLSRPVASVAQVQAVVNNVAQNPSDAFTVSGSTITFTSAPSSGTNNIYVYYTSPITQVIAPGQGTVTTTSLATNFTLPVANGGTGLTTVPHTVQVFTSGSGTYTLPTNCKAILIELVGGGAGGSASSNGAAGGAGGNTTFSTLTGTGGTSVVPTLGGLGGAASGGDVNIAGGSASGSYQAYTTSGASYTSGGVGGVSYFGGAGRGAAPGGSTGGAAATNSGSGGGGGAQNTTAYAGTGGGAGGYVRKLINSPSATYSYAVGAGGAGGTAGVTDSQAGGAGGSGIIIVQEFYV